MKMKKEQQITVDLSLRKLVDASDPPVLVEKKMAKKNKQNKRPNSAYFDLEDLGGLDLFPLFVWVWLEKPKKNDAPSMIRWSFLCSSLLQ